MKEQHELFSALEEITGITREQIMSKSRKQNIGDAKKLLQLVLRHDAKWTFKKVAKFFDCDHSSVIHNNNVLLGLLENDSKIRAQYETLRVKLQFFGEIKERPVASYFALPAKHYKHANRQII